MFLRFDVFDSGDVEEVILVVVREKPFHLRRVHAAVRLRYIDCRVAEVRERYPPASGESQAAEASRIANHGDQDRHRPTHGSDN